MLLTISTTRQPATDLGYLLHKHPDRFQSVKLSIGQAHLFYPENSEARSTIALMLDIDPIDLVRGSRNSSGKDFALGQYVNDRPYAASSFMSVALSKAFSSALNGKCKDKPELVDQPLPLEACISVLPAPKGGEMLIRKLFEPLGYTVNLSRLELDAQFPSWGDSKYYRVELAHTLTIRELLSHLYVLIPALDLNKHYFVSTSEIEKLLERGKGWLDAHPEKEQITRRYMINLGSLTRQALERLNTEEGTTEEAEPVMTEKQLTLHQKRLDLVHDQLKKSQAVSVLDLGCGEGKLLRMLLKEKQFARIAGMDISYQELTRAKERLHYDEMAPRQKERLTLFQGSLTYRDKRLSGYDAAALVEVIEHLDENRLPALERVVFEFAQPGTVIVTTPNSEYNALYETMQAGAMRHTDHRFEWTRNQFETWSKSVAETHGYTVRFLPIGDEEPEVGAPSQMAIFTHGN